MSRCLADRILHRGTSLAALLAGSLFVLIVVFVAQAAAPAVERPGLWRLLSDAPWLPSAGRFGIVPLLAGSLLVTLGSLLIAAPLGVFAGMFLEVYAPRIFAIVFRRLLELLAGVPSVVIGYWGLTEIVPLINRLQPPGQSLLAGILVLAVMIMPVTALTSAASMRSVLVEHRAGIAALGLSRWTMLRGVVLPNARRGIVSGMILAAARAIGETMAVVMVCGNVVQLPDSLFAPVRTLTANIALEMGDVAELQRSALFLSGLVLIVLTGVATLFAGVRSAEAVHA